MARGFPEVARSGRLGDWHRLTSGVRAVFLSTLRSGLLRREGLSPGEEGESRCGLAGGFLCVSAALHAEALGRNLSSVR